jgi:DNA-binding NarL/FixJ family response regulator
MKWIRERTKGEWIALPGRYGIARVEEFYRAASATTKELTEITCMGMDGTQEFSIGVLADLYLVDFNKASNIPMPTKSKVGGVELFQPMAIYKKGESAPYEVIMITGGGNGTRVHLDDHGAPIQYYPKDAEGILIERLKSYERTVLGAGTKFLESGEIWEISDVNDGIQAFQVDHPTNIKKMTSREFAQGLREGVLKIMVEQPQQPQQAQHRRIVDPAFLDFVKRGKNLGDLNLTDEEMKVMTYIIEGLEDPAIAAAMKISRATVGRRFSSAKKKWEDFSAGVKREVPLRRENVNSAVPGLRDFVRFGDGKVALTKRQITVVEATTLGGNEAVGERLFITAETVKKTLQGAIEKRKAYLSQPWVIYTYEQEGNVDVIFVKNIQDGRYIYWRKGDAGSLSQATTTIEADKLVLLLNKYKRVPLIKGMRFKYEQDSKEGHWTVQFTHENDLYAFPTNKSEKETTRLSMEVFVAHLSNGKIKMLSPTSKGTDILAGIVLIIGSLSSIFHALHGASGAAAPGITAILWVPVSTNWVWMPWLAALSLTAVGVAVLLVKGMAAPLWRSRTFKLILGAAAFTLLLRAGQDVELFGMNFNSNHFFLASTPFLLIASGFILMIQWRLLNKSLRPATPLESWSIYSKGEKAFLVEDLKPSVGKVDVYYYDLESYDKGSVQFRVEPDDWLMFTSKSLAIPAARLLVRRFKKLDFVNKSFREWRGERRIFTVKETGGQLFKIVRHTEAGDVDDFISAREFFRRFERKKLLEYTPPWPLADTLRNFVEKGDGHEVLTEEEMDFIGSTYGHNLEGFAKNLNVSPKVVEQKLLIADQKRRDYLFQPGAIFRRKGSDQIPYDILLIRGAYAGDIHYWQVGKEDHDFDIKDEVATQKLLNGYTRLPLHVGTQMFNGDEVWTLRQVGMEVIATHGTQPGAAEERETAASFAKNISDGVLFVELLYPPTNLTPEELVGWMHRRSLGERLYIPEYFFGKVKALDETGITFDFDRMEQHFTFEDLAERYSNTYRTWGKPKTSTILDGTVSLPHLRELAGTPAGARLRWAQFFILRATQFFSIEQIGNELNVEQERIAKLLRNAAKKLALLAMAAMTLVYGYHVLSNLHGSARQRALSA